MIYARRSVNPSNISAFKNGQKVSELNMGSELTSTVYEKMREEKGNNRLKNRLFRTPLWAKPVTVNLDADVLALTFPFSAGQDSSDWESSFLPKSVDKRLMRGWVSVVGGDNAGLMLYLNYGHKDKTPSRVSRFLLRTLKQQFLKVVSPESK